MANRSIANSSGWSVYLVRCTDGSLYTGVALDVSARIEQHNKGKGAKYTRGRGPVELLYCEVVGERGDAQRREYAIKQLSKAQKIAMISVDQGYSK